MTPGFGHTEVTGDLREGSLNGGLETEAWSAWAGERMGSGNVETRVDSFLRKFTLKGRQSVGGWMRKEDEETF